MTHNGKAAALYGEERQNFKKCRVRRISAGDTAVKGIAYIVLALGGVAMVYPIIFIVLSGLFTADEFDATVMTLFPIAQSPTLKNLQKLLFIGLDGETLMYYLNSILRTLYGTFFSCFTALLGGFVFARLRFKLKEVLFMVFLATQMIPTIVGTLPMYMQLRALGLYDTYGVYLLLNGGIINIMGTFLVRQTLQEMPRSIEEAAKVDGAHLMRVIFQIALPALRTILIYIAITSAIGIWNDWSVPFFYTDSQMYQTIPSALTRLTSFAGKEGERMNYPLIMSFSLLVTVPSAIIFFIFQKHIVNGLMSAGIKG